MYIHYTPFLHLMFGWLDNVSFPFSHFITVVLSFRFLVSRLVEKEFFKLLGSAYTISLFVITIIIGRLFVLFPLIPLVSRLFIYLSKGGEIYVCSEEEYVFFFPLKRDVVRCERLFGFC